MQREKTPRRVRPQASKSSLIQPMAFAYVVLLAPGVACHPAPSLAPQREPVGSPQQVDPTREAEHPFCCEACEHTEGQGLRCQACDPVSADKACAQERVDCGHNLRTWDGSTRELVCEDTPRNSISPPLAELSASAKAPSAAEEPAPSPAETDPRAPVLWDDLMPIRVGWASRKGINVTFPFEPGDSPITLENVEEILPPHHRRVPERVRTARLTLVSTKGASPIPPLRTVSSISTPIADEWFGTYGPAAVDGTVLVTSSPPHPDATLHVAARAKKFPPQSRYTKQVFDGIKASLRDYWLENLQTASAEVQYVLGNFPDGAIAVVAATLWTPHAEILGTIYTVDADGDVVTRLLPSDEYSPTIDVLVDLDGDGVDEVLMHSSVIEDYVVEIIHISGQKAVSYTLSDTGH